MVEILAAALPEAIGGLVTVLVVFVITKKLWPIYKRDRDERASSNEVDDDEKRDCNIQIERVFSSEPLPKDFVGRAAEIEIITREVTSDGAKTIGLFGIGGAGKTSLAVKLAHHLKDLFPEGQIFIDFKGTSSNQLAVDDAMRQIAQYLNPDFRPPKTEDELRRSLISTLYERRLIIILDNVSGKSQVAPLLLSDTALFIMTSRLRFVVPGIFSVSVGSLSLKESKVFLKRIAKRLGDHEAEELANFCGCLPHPMRIAASTLAERVDIPFEMFMQELQSSTSDHLERFEASIRVSSKLLRNKNRGKWFCLSIFSETFDQAAAAAVLQLDPHEASGLLSELVVNNLIEWTDGRRYRLHDITRLYALGKISHQESNEACRRHAEYYLDTLNKAGDLFDLGHDDLIEGLRIFDRESSNVSQAQSWVSSHALDTHDLARLCCEYADANRHIYTLRVAPQDRVEWLKFALKASRFLEDRNFECVTLGNLGMAYGDLGDYKNSLQCNTMYLEISREIDDNEHECRALGNLGNDYYDVENFKDALDCHTQSLLIAREARHYEYTCRALCNIGNVHKKLGRFPQALINYQEGHSIAERMGNRLYEAIVLGSIGGLWRKIGNIPKAIELYQQKLTRSREISFFTGKRDALANLGEIHEVRGDYESALSFYAELLTVTKNSSDSKYEAQILLKLADLHFHCGDRSISSGLYAKCSLVARQAEDIPVELLTVATLSVDLGGKGRAQEPAKHFRRYKELAKLSGFHSKPDGNPSFAGLFQLLISVRARKEGRSRLARLYAVSLATRRAQRRITPLVYYLKYLFGAIFTALYVNDYPRTFYRPHNLLRAIAVVFVVAITVAMGNLMMMPDDKTAMAAAPSSLYVKEGLPECVTAGDLVLALDGHAMSNCADMLMYLKDASDEGHIDLTVFRPSQERKISCSLYVAQLAAFTIVDLPRTVYIKDVLEGGSAARAGVQKGDLVTAIGGSGIFRYTETRMRQVYSSIGSALGRDFTKTYAVNDLIRRPDVGTILTFTILRNGMEHQAHLVMDRWRPPYLLVAVVFSGIFGIFLACRTARIGNFGSVIRFLSIFFLLLHFSVVSFGAKSAVVDNIVDIIATASFLGLLFPLFLVRVFDFVISILTMPLRRVFPNASSKK